jgi:hypothetical protein
VPVRGQRDRGMPDYLLGQQRTVEAGAAGLLSDGWERAYSERARVFAPVRFASMIGGERFMVSKQAPAPPAATGKVRRNWFPRWRIFTWVILAFNVIMLIWVITGTASGESCSGKTGYDLTECEAGQAGTGIGVFLVILLWALGDIILGVLWLVTKPRKRECPACGNSVRKGVMQCGACGYDFRQMLQKSEQGRGPPQGGEAGGWPERPPK